MSLDYKQQAMMRNNEKIRELRGELPIFLNRYINASLDKSSHTIVSYLSKFKTFLQFLTENYPQYQGKQLSAFTLQDLAGIDQFLIEDFSMWLNTTQVDQTRDRKAGDKLSTINVYLSALSSIWTYYESAGLLHDNPFRKVKRMKRARSSPSYLRGEENVSFYEDVISGDRLTERSRSYRDKQGSSYRDYMIVRMMGLTGIRVSELVGLDIDDFVFSEHFFYVVRKGKEKTQERARIYINDELLQEIQEYLADDRPSYHPDPAEKAMFLVAQGKYTGKRLGVRSVENIVKKYAMSSGIIDAAEFHPHSLRHSFAMNSLRNSGNIALVQAQLGHANIETTTVYAHVEQEILRKERNSGTWKKTEEE